jgi:hypothetical protein
MLPAPCSTVDAQQTGKVPRIGILDATTASSSAVLWDAFRQELSKLGWNEGKNFSFEYRYAEQKPERLPELAADLVRLKVDVIVAAGTPPPLAAKNATTTIPIVMTNVGDPVASGLIASLARPGGNVTGLSSLSPELNTKRLEVLKDAVPICRVRAPRRFCISLREWNSMGSTRNARSASRIEADDPRGAHPIRRSGERLSAHTWRAKNFSSTAQISGT